MVVVTSLGPPEEGIHHKEEKTTTYINEKNIGKGTLYVSESRVSWVGDVGHKFSLEYPHISLHAVSRVCNLIHFINNNGNSTTRNSLNWPELYIFLLGYYLIPPFATPLPYD